MITSSILKYRLLWLQEKLTRGTVQRLTGIHWNRQESVLQGTRELTRPEKTKLHSLYRQETYRSFRTAGFSVKQSKLFVSEPPDMVTNRIKLFDNVIDVIVNKQFVNKTKYWSRRERVEKGGELLKSLNIHIRERFRKSNKSFVQWMNYES